MENHQGPLTLAFEEEEARYQAVLLARMNPGLGKLLLQLHGAGVGWREILSRLREFLAAKQRSVDELNTGPAVTKPLAMAPPVPIIRGLSTTGSRPDQLLHTYTLHTERPST